jgi:tagatose-1,6-bisphosphate aldolase non-catalytic subunit AgaZ/GatZ
MIHQRLQSFIRRRHCTLLGVGPMSVNCVDATVELANEYEVPIIMIASRRQIDSAEFDGGYVNNWTTDEFARYVTDKDKKGKLLLARDHGGPWQSERERDECLGLRRAMASAKSSFSADISAGFQILHIDPSIDIHGKPDLDEIIDRIFELYEYCWITAQKCNREVIFEIGTDEQTGSTNSQEELDYTLASVKTFCQRNGLPQPTFVVVQCGTRVMETRNVGSFDLPLRVANEIPAEIQLPKMLEICNKHDILMKEHNTDYLSDEALQWHPRLGIHAANVAPEFGVAESRALVETLERNGLDKLADAFLKLAFDSGKWRKWLLPASKATDRDKALIAGHYVFSSPQVKTIKLEAQNALIRKGIDLDMNLRNHLKLHILRYLRNFRVVRTI